MSTKVNQIALYSFILLLCIFAWLVVITPIHLSGVLYYNWICDIACLFISILAIIVLNVKGKCDILSVPFFVGVIYIIMFFITPLYDLFIGEISIFDAFDLFDYGIQGSLYALIGFIAFCLIYANKVHPYQARPYLQFSSAVKRKIENTAIVLWAIEFVVGIICVILTQGFSVSYILSFGMLGDSNAYETSSSLLGFIVQFTRGIVPLSLIIFAVSSRKQLLISVCFLTAMFEVISGFRYMIVIMICGFFYFQYLSKNKKVPIFTIILLALGLSFVVGIVGFTRGSVRSGVGFTSQGFGADDVVDAVLGNFRIYKSYYAVIKAVPSMTPYLYFDQMLIYTMIMAIPRAIWPNKPLNPGTDAQLYGMGEVAVKSGYAYPNLGEYYYSFGVFGVIFFMGLFGWWLAKITNKYRYRPNTILDVAQYCILVPLTLQLLIRGYTPSNFYLIIALVFPFWFLRRYVLKNNSNY